MAERPPITIDNFTGGLNRNWPEKIGPNESSVLQNMIHIDGSLTTINGRNLYNQVEILPNTPVKSLDRFYKTGHRVNDTAATTKQGWTLARCGEYVWLACEQSELVNASALNSTSIKLKTKANIKTVASSGIVLVTPASGDTTPYALAYTAKNESTGVITVGDHPAIPDGSTITFCDFRPILYTPGDTEPVDFEAFNGREYIAVNGLYRWDGFYYAVGTASCAGGTTTVKGVNTTWGTGTSVVKPGDSIFFKVGGTWSSNYTISTVTDNNTLKLTANGPNTGGSVDYIIARVHNAGVLPPMTAPTLTAAPAVTSSLDTGAVYKYAYSYAYYVWDGSNWVWRESEALSPVYTSAATAAGDYFTIGVPVSWTPYSEFTTYDNMVAIRIYRTEGGGSTFKFLKEGYYLPKSHVFTPSSEIRFTETDLAADTWLGPNFPMSTTSPLVKIPNLAPTCTKHASGSNLTAGLHKYKFTLYNSTTGAESNASPEAEVTSAVGGQVTVAINTSGLDRQADTVRIYRTAAGGSIYKFLTELPWEPGAAYIEFIDRLADTSLGRALNYDHDPSPKGVYHVKAHNGTLFCWGDSDNPDILHFSTVNDGEHWPGYEYGVNEPTEYDPTLGGYVRIGHPGEKIVSIVTDNGAYADTGGVGASLIIHTKLRKYRWWGENWANYRREEMGAGGNASSASVVNCGGPIAWLDRSNGPVIKPIGSVLTQPIYQAVFPPRYKFADSVTAGNSTTDYFELCSAAYWGDYLVFTWPETPSTIPNKMMMFHLPTGTFTEIGTESAPCKAYCLSVWSGAGDNDALYYGDAEKGYVWRLHAKTGDYTYWTPSSATGVTAEHRTGAILTTAKQARLYDIQHVRNIRLVFNRPIADQTVTVAVYPNAKTTTTATESVTIASAEGSEPDAGDRVVVDARPQLDTRSVILGWSGTFTCPVTLQGYEYSNDYHGSGSK